MSEDLVHVTIGHPRRGLMDLLAETAEWHGCRHVAMPRHWPLGPFGVMNKITVLRSYLETGEVHPGQIVMFTDAYDVTVIEHASIIVEKFLATGAAIVFSAESNFWPAEGREVVRLQFDDHPSKWKYLNSGGYIGYAWAIRRMLDYCHGRMQREDYDFHKPDDQALVQRFYLEHLGSEECPVALDTVPDIFCSLNASLQDFELSKGRVSGARSGRTVSILHANGAKANLDVMSRCWALSGGLEGKARRRDLRIATEGGRPLAYDRKSAKLAPRGRADGFPAVFLVKGDRQAICLSDEHGILTFTPSGALECGATVLNVWEVINIRPAITTYHRSALDSYCDLPASPAIALSPLPLSILANPSFDGLVQMIKRYEQRF